MHQTLVIPLIFCALNQQYNKSCAELNKKKIEIEELIKQEFEDKNSALKQYHLNSKTLLIKI